MNSISKNLFFLFLFFFSLKFYNFENGIKNKSQMRITLSGNSIIFVKHKGKINSFYGCTKEEEEKKEVIIIENNKKEEEEEKEKRTYTIDKKKLIKKARAFGALEQSKNFIGFYSISFPLNFSDENCRKCLNIWLTKLRAKYNLSNYIWVAERQKNKTLHFHLLTNNRMPIREVNYQMAKTIDFYIKKTNEKAGNFTLKGYNGVDLSYCGKSRKNQKKQWKKEGQTIAERNKFIASYISKYVTKNKGSWSFLPCHYSRSVSALATGFLLNEKEKEILTKEILPNISIWKVFEKDYITVIITEEEIPIKMYKRLMEYNQYRYNKEISKIA